MWLAVSLELFAVGDNKYGKLGIDVEPHINNSIYFFSPVVGINETEIHRLHVGFDHTLVTDNNNKLYAWGDNLYNELGWTDELYAKKPHVVPFFAEHKLKVKMADGGISHTVVLLEDGTVYSFGSNASGQLGRFKNDTDGIDWSEPMRVDLSNLQRNEKIKSVHTQMLITYALTDEGNLYFWGSCQNNLCPDHNSNTVVAIPTKAKINMTVSYVHVGIFNVFWMDNSTDRNIYAIGMNHNGELCLKLDRFSSNVPEKLPIKNVSVIDAARYHTIFLQNGVVFGCGRGDDGELGGATTERNNTTPIIISSNITEKGAYSITDVGVTYTGTVLLRNDGHLYATGTNHHGELGLGENKLYVKDFTYVAVSHNISRINEVISHGTSTYIYCKVDMNKNLSPAAVASISIASVVIAIGIGVLFFFLWKCNKLECKKCCVKTGPKYQHVHETEDESKLIFNDDQW